MKACGFVVGPETGPGATLRDLARQVGFETVLGIRSVAAAERQSQSTPLVFFLFAPVVEASDMQPMAAAVRGSPVDAIRYAPMVYFADSPSRELIQQCIAMGFDDIIALPSSLARVGDRLGRQVGRPLYYYETASYFGPDRRGRMENEELHEDRGTGGAHRRIEIIRHPATGVEVTSDDAAIMI